MHQGHHLRQSLNLLVAFVRQVQLESQVDVDPDLQKRQRVELQVVVVGMPFDSSSSRGSGSARHRSGYWGLDELAKLSRYYHKLAVL